MITPFLIALALSALRWAWTGLKFRSFAILTAWDSGIAFAARPIEYSRALVLLEGVKWRHSIDKCVARCLFLVARGSLL